jgi:hypothetical protein
MPLTPVAITTWRGRIRLIVPSVQRNVTVQHPSASS